MSDIGKIPSGPAELSVQRRRTRHIAADPSVTATAGGLLFPLSYHLLDSWLDYFAARSSHVCPDFLRVQCNPRWMVEASTHQTLNLSPMRKGMRRTSCGTTVTIVPNAC